MKILFGLLFSATFVTVVIGPLRWNRLWKGSSSSSGSPRRQEESSGSGDQVESSGSGSAAGQAPTSIIRWHEGPVLVQQPGERFPGYYYGHSIEPVTLTLDVRMREVGLLDSAEYGRLMSVVNQVTQGNVTYKNLRNKNQAQANMEVPWLADAGLLVGKDTFIRFCAASLLHLDEGEESNVLITSVQCGLMLEKAGKAAVKFYGRRKDENYEVLAIRYLKEDGSDVESNLAMLEITPRKISERSKQLRLTPNSESTVTEITWRNYQYRVRDGKGEIVSNLNRTGLRYRAGCDRCSAKTFCITNDIDNEPDLGGAPLCEVMGSNFEHPVLVGVRDGLDGDHFTDIDDDRIKAWITGTAARLQQPERQ